MRKSDWIESHEEEMKRYDKSILYHEENFNNDDYDSPIGLHYEADSLDDYESCIKHFQD